MANLSIIFGILGNIISILVFASPIKTFRRIVKKKSTEKYSGIPYVTTLLSTSLWTFYGVLKPGGLLVATVNGAGASLQFLYVTLFLIYSPRNIKVKTAKLAAILDVGCFGVVVAVSLLAMHGKMRFTFVGILCALLNIGMYASPLAIIRTVIKTKSVEYMPFLLSFFLFLNGGIWSAYAVLVKDLFIVIPNAIGFILGAIQLVVYGIYKNKSVREEASDHKQSIEMNLPSEENGSSKGFDEEQANAKRSLSKGTSLPLPRENELSRQ